MTALYHDECRCLSALAMRVENAANKLSAVGLDRVAHDLFEISDSIGGVRTMILAKQSEDLEKEVRAAERGSVDMLTGILKIMDMPGKTSKVQVRKDGFMVRWNDKDSLDNTGSDP